MMKVVTQGGAFVPHSGGTAGMLCAFRWGFRSGYYLFAGLAWLVFGVLFWRTASGGLVEESAGAVWFLAMLIGLVLLVGHFSREFSRAWSDWPYLADEADFFRDHFVISAGGFGSVVMLVAALGPKSAFLALFSVAMAEGIGWIFSPTVAARLVGRLRNADRGISAINPTSVAPSLPRRVERQKEPNSDLTVFEADSPFEADFVFEGATVLEEPIATPFLPGIFEPEDSILRIDGGDFWANRGEFGGLTGEGEDEDEWESEPDPTTSGQWRRHISETTGETLEGWVRLIFEPRREVRVVHLAFCPPFESLPALELFPLSGPEVTVTVTQIQTFGARLEVKRHRATGDFEGAAFGEERVRLAFVANAVLP